MEKILEYLVEKYQPEGMIVYGSFADGSYNENSDFDVLVIASGEKRHDASVVDGTVLDAFVYPPETFAGAFDPADFVQIFDGKIVLDSKGVAAKMKARVLAYLDALPMKAMDEVRQDVAWCRKMQSRTLRGDAEGFLPLALVIDGKPSYLLRRTALALFRAEEGAAADAAGAAGALCGIQDGFGGLHAVCAVGLAGLSGGKHGQLSHALSFFLQFCIQCVILNIPSKIRRNLHEADYRNRPG